MGKYFDELQAKYSAKSHPEVLSGRKTEDEVLKEFMDTFQDTYNYLCGTESDNIVTLEEFMEYYENISMTIDDDDYFETMLNNAWNNQNTSYKKAWVNKEENEEEKDNKMIIKYYHKIIKKNSEIADQVKLKNKQRKKKPLMLLKN